MSLRNPFAVTLIVIVLKFENVFGAAMETSESYLGSINPLVTLVKNAPNRLLILVIKNNVNFTLHGGDYYVHWGLNSMPPPVSIRGRTNKAFVFQKRSHTATGTSGVVVYEIGENSGDKFAISFSVPFNYNHASNWFGLKWIDSLDEADKELYNKMWYDEAWKYPTRAADYKYAYEEIPAVIYKKHFAVSALMTNEGQAVLKVNINFNRN